jgi:hypothetical protein
LERLTGKLIYCKACYRSFSENGTLPRADDLSCAGCIAVVNELRPPPPPKKVAKKKTEEPPRKLSKNWHLNVGMFYEGEE